MTSIFSKLSGVFQRLSNSVIDFHDTFAAVAAMRAPLVAPVFSGLETLPEDEFVIAEATTMKAIAPGDPIPCYRAALIATESINPQGESERSPYTLYIRLERQTLPGPRAPESTHYFPLERTHLEVRARHFLILWDEIEDYTSRQLGKIIDTVPGYQWRRDHRQPQALPPREALPVKLTPPCR